MPYNWIIAEGGESSFSAAGNDNHVLSYQYLQSSSAAQEIRLSINISGTTVTGIPSVASQTIASNIEGAAFFGGNTKDSYTFSFESLNGTFRHLEIRSYAGDDSLVIEGFFSELDSRANDISYGTAFYDGADGYDVLILDGSINDYILEDATDIDERRRFLVRDEDSDALIDLYDVEEIFFDDDSVKLGVSVDYFDNRSLDDIDPSVWFIQGPSDQNDPWESAWDILLPMRQGWFWDDKRNNKDGTSFYLFSSDDTTTVGEGTPGYTVGSNLPELLLTTDNGDPSYDSWSRQGEVGDNLAFSLLNDRILINGIGPHAVTGKSPQDQTLYSTEAIYWEGTYYNDEIDLDVQSTDSICRTFFFVGNNGSDTLNITGYFEALDGTYNGSRELVDVANTFVGDGGILPGDYPEGDPLNISHDNSTDILRIDDYVTNGYSILYQELDYSLFGTANPSDVQTLFKISKGGAVYYAVDVEVVSFIDRDFERSNIILANPEGEVLYGSASDDYMGGNDGQDYLTGGDGSDFLNGMDGDDYLYAGDGDDSVMGGGGSDLLVGGDGRGDDYYDGGSGVDTIRYTSSTTSPITVSLRTGLASGNDIGSDTLANIENVIGGQLDDLISGNADNNFMDGQSGIDTVIFVGSQSQYGLSINSAGDFVVADTSQNRDGTDTLRGIEYVQFSDRRLLVSELIRSLGISQSVTGTASSVVVPVEGQAASTSSSSTEATSFTSRIAGLKYQESVTTLELANAVQIGDLLFSRAVAGTSRRDVIIGGDDSELLAGGQGADQITGGGGPDAFLFETPDEFGKKGADVVTDFNSAEGDTIAISKEVFVNVEKIKLDRVSSKRETRMAQRGNSNFVYNDRNGLLYFDSNGKKSGWGDGGQFVQLLGAPEISAVDIVVL